MSRQWQRERMKRKRASFRQKSRPSIFLRTRLWGSLRNPRPALHNLSRRKRRILRAIGILTDGGMLVPQAVFTNMESAHERFCEDTLDKFIEQMERQTLYGSSGQQPPRGLRNCPAEELDCFIGLPGSVTAMEVDWFNWQRCPLCFGTGKVELLRETIPCTLCRNGLIPVEGGRG